MDDVNGCPAGKEEQQCARFLQIDKMLVEEECQLLISHLDSKINRAALPQRNIIYAHQVDDQEVMSLLQEVCYHIVREMCNFYQESALYLHTVAVRRWLPSERTQSSLLAVPNCKYTAFVWLNSNFTTGEFYFGLPAGPHEILKCNVGRLVGFGSGEDYMHGMLPAATGNRYILHVDLTDRPPK